MIDFAIKNKDLYDDILIDKIRLLIGYLTRNLPEQQTNETLEDNPITTLLSNYNTQWEFLKSDYTLNKLYFIKKELKNPFIDSEIDQFVDKLKQLSLK